MHRTSRRRLSTFLSPAVVLAMTLALLAAGSVAAGASSAAPSAAGAVKQSVRSIPRGASLTFPTNQRVGTVHGVQSPEIRPGEEGEGEGVAAARVSAAHRHNKPAARSLSVRPTARSAPQRAAAAGLSIPNVTPTAVAGSRPGLRQSFEGLNHFDQRTANNGNQFSIEPPDQGLCVGNGFVLETINDVLQVYDTKGNALSPVTDLNTFYGYPPAVNRTTGVIGPQLTDPSCLFDAATNRWFHVVLTLEVDPADGGLLGPNHLDIAVSRTSSPLGGWNIYQLPVQDDGTQGTPSHVDCPCIGDYPHIGADKFGFFISTNEYPLSDDPGLYGNNYNGAQIYAFSKAALAAGAASVNVVQFESPELGDGTPSFTAWPAQFNPGGFVTRDNGTEYFLQTNAAEETLNDEGMDNRIGFWRMTNTRSLDTASPAPRLASAVLGSETYGVPPLSEQKGGSVPLRDCLLVACLTGVGPSPGEVEGPLDSLDSRMQQTWFADGKLYGAFGTIANVAGNIKAAIAWVVVNPSSPRITSQGYLGVARNNVTMPAVAVLPSGRGVLAFTLVGTRHFPSAGYAEVRNGRVTGDARVAGRGAGPEDSFCEYRFFNCANTDPPAIRPRWGDYGAAVTQGNSVWIASEWIGQTCTFSAYLQDTTCGGTRTALANWSTRVSLVKP
jgi:hypothetical protein